MEENDAALDEAAPVQREARLCKVIIEVFEDHKLVAEEADELLRPARMFVNVGVRL
jgi:hypothetical protein